MILLLSFAFLAGLVTILAPCIWPLLPIVLSSSVAGKEAGQRRPLGVVLGILVSFTVFTLTVSSLVKAFHFNPDSLRIIAVVIISILGLAMIVPGFNRILELFISRISSKFGTSGQNTNTGFGAGFLTGLSLGIVWSPCAGPILASITVLAATGKVSGSVILVTVAYVVGVGIPLLLFAYAGRRLLTRTKALNKYTGRIQQIFGFIMILTAVLILTNYDKVLEAKLLNVFPGLSSSITALDTNSIVKKQLDALKGQATQAQDAADTNALFNANTPAPDFTGATHWLNTDKPISLADLKGKVVLVDFWTYTCINCIRTLPFVTSWYDKYKDQGFVVIGVHTPEFAFEKETSNVSQAIERFKIHYPVPQDNDYAIWNGFNNEYWPAEYLIDAEGNIRRTHFGEGEYDQTEKAIQALLKEAGRKNVTGKTVNMPDETPKTQLSPESYVGSKRMEFLSSHGSVGNGTQTFTGETPDVNTFSFGGEWNISDEYAMSGKDATITYHFIAQKVFLVMKPPATGSGKVDIWIDGKLIKVAQVGADVHAGVVTVDSDRLYELVNLSQVETHVLKLQFETPGTAAFAFTFG